MDTQKMFVLLGCCLLLVPSASPQTIFECNFDGSSKQSEEFLCDCSGSTCELEQDVLQDQFNWMAWDGTTPSGDTGPGDDHTHGDGTGLYIYAEASDVNPGQQAMLHSPSLSLSQTGCMTFWYSMHGQHVGILQVLARFSNDTTATIWEKSGDLSENWLEAKLALDSTVARISFRTTRGGATVGMPYGDVALDDIKIENQLCVGFTESPDQTTHTQAVTTSTTSSTTTTTNPTTTTITNQPATSRSPTTSTTQPQTSTTAKPATTITTVPTTTRLPTTTSTSTHTSPPATDTTATTAAVRTTRTPAPVTGSQQRLWGLDETLWIIILVVAGAVILVLLVIVCVQACAMRRMRSARIVHQSDDYSNIEAYNRDQFPVRGEPPKRDNFINAYDNMAMEHDDKNTPHSNGGGMI